MLIDMAVLIDLLAFSNLHSEVSFLIGLIHKNEVT